MPLDFFRKFSTHLEDYIGEKKWPAFIEICEDYCKEKVRSKIGEFRAINKVGKESYEWNGINRQKAESLALFITALKLRNILDRKGVNFRYAVAFLRFFNMKKRPKWLSTKIDSNPEEARRVFQFDTLPAVNS